METPVQGVRLKTSFENGKTRPLSFRKDQLKSLLKMYETNSKRIITALCRDLKRSAKEILLTEITPTIEELKEIIANFESWSSQKMANTKRKSDKVYMLKEPYGLVLVIAAWFYPFLYSVLPTAAAIAAGNVVLVSPSEYSPNVSKVLNDLFPKYLDPDCYGIILGKLDIENLPFEEFDYIFYTGSNTVAKQICENTRPRFIPATVQSLSKNAVFLDETANMELSVKRIVWAKFFNAGQTMAAPDFLLCSRGVEERFLQLARRFIIDFFGVHSENSKDFGRILNVEHFDRLDEKLYGKDIAFGGAASRELLYFGPTIVINVSLDDPIMKEAVFGPILPIVSCMNIHDAVKTVNYWKKTAALYIFSQNKTTISQFVNTTKTNTICLNDTCVLLMGNLPYSIGLHGIEFYHGKCSFDLFSLNKTCLFRNFSAFTEKSLKNRYPPYKKMKIKGFDKLVKICIGIR